MTKQILVTRSDFPSNGIDILKEKFDLKFPSNTSIIKDELLHMVKDVFGIFCVPPLKIDEEVLNAAGHNLKVISTFSVGYDHLDVKEIKSRGIRIGYTPNVLTEDVAEMALTLALTVGRRILEANKELSNDLSNKWTPLWLCGHGLYKSVVGIIGMGRIGLSIAKKAKSFSISKLLYYGRKENPEGRHIGAVFTDLNTLMAECDFIWVAATLTSETEKIISKEKIALMKSTAFLINVGRGGLVDHDALLEALQNEKIGGAGLDVTVPEPLPLDHPLLHMDNVVITPHIASATYRTRYKMADVAARNIVSALEGTKMVYEL